MSVDATCRCRDGGVIDDGVGRRQHRVIVRRGTTMDATKLPDEAIQALRQGQKILAIKIVRQHTGLGLAEAKNAVEAAVAADPWLKKQCESAVSRGASGLRLSTLILVIVAAVVAWLKFTGRF